MGRSLVLYGTHINITRWQVVLVIYIYNNNTHCSKNKAGHRHTVGYVSGRKKAWHWQLPRADRAVDTEVKCVRIRIRVLYAVRVELYSYEATHIHIIHTALYNSTP